MDDVDPRIGRAKAFIATCFIQMLKRSRISQRKLAKLAEKAGVYGKNRPYLNEIANGEANPSVETLAGLASLCGYEFQDFVSGIPAADVPRGMKVEDIPRRHRQFYSLLSE